MVDGVVLDVELLEPELGAEAVALQQRREAGIRSRLGLAIDRQQLAIAPEVVRARRDRRARDRGANLRVVVGDFERAEAILAYVQRLDRIFLAALAALEIGDVAHRMVLSLLALLIAARGQRRRISARRAAPQAHPARALTSSQRACAPRLPRHRSGFFPPARAAPPPSQRSASAASISPIAAGDRADYSGLAATCDLARLGRLLEQASQTRRAPRQYRHRLTGHPEHAGVNEGPPEARRRCR